MNAPNSPAQTAWKPFQFRLWHLFALLTLVSVVTAACVQLGAHAIPCLALGFAGFFITYAGAKGKWGLAFAVFLVTSVGFMMIPVVDVIGPSKRSLCQSNLRQIALALRVYHETHGSYPPAYIADKYGKPMHSWRAILSTTIDSNFKSRYRFDEPWDSPNNRRVAAEARTGLFSCPGERSPLVLGETNYVAVVGPWTTFPGAKCISEKDVKDGLANTVLLVEVHDSGIYWTEPRDLPVWQAMGTKSGKGLSTPHGDGANVVMADGTVVYLEGDSLTPEMVRALLTIDGGESVVIP